MIKLEEGETLQFKPDKKKWHILAIALFCPGWLFISLIFIVPCFSNMFLGSISFDSGSEYIGSIIILVIFVPGVLFYLMSYFGNQFIITDKRIIIRKSISGTVHKINFSDIYAYRHYSYATKGITNDNIWIYLKSGKLIQSGNLYIKKNNLSYLINTLNSKLNHTLMTKVEYKEYKNQCKSNCDIKTSRNIVIQGISLFPFIAAFIMLVLYVCGFNEKGKQTYIQVSGSVVKKSVNYSKDNEEPSYDFIVIKDITEEKYKISVDKEIYYRFNEKDKVFIEAKKGSLGIVYDEWFYGE
ncbi:hypothetical protein [Clostridium sp. Marseille-P299]|uniref:hypothetical protein n=1 Tax=Clostridium sp. Marseille-P299 TaxID=1805477 RepID=UPI000836F0DD|nr:hypothetical protein [Clostridium sp. Marseille-P299]